MSTIDWTASLDGLWSNGADWSGGAPPGSNDTAVITSGGSLEVIYVSETSTIHALAIIDALLLLQSGSLDVSNGASISGQLSIYDGDLTVGGLSSISGELIQSFGTLAIQAGGTLTLTDAQFFNGMAEISGGGTLATTGTTVVDERVYLCDGLDWENSGTILDGDAIYSGTLLPDANADGFGIEGATATLTNLAGAVFDLEGGVIGNIGTLTFINYGTLIETGSGNLSSIDVFLTNAAGATITSDGAGLDILYGGDFGGTLNGTAQVDFGGGTSTVNGTLTVIGVFNQTGGVIAVGQGDALTLAAYAQFGPGGTGDIDGTGTLATTGTLVVSEDVALSGGLTWDNSGTVEENAIVYARDASGATETLVNLPGAVFLTGNNATVADSTYSNQNGNQTSALIFVNEGTLEKTGGGVGAFTAALTNTPEGTITSDGGALAIYDGGSFSGAIDGAGEVDFAGGTAAVSGTLTVTNVFNQTGGVIAVGQGDTLALFAYAQFGLAGAGPYTGEVDGAGTLATTGTLTVNEHLFLGGGLHWNNSGTILDASNVYGGDTNGATATLTNMAGAVFAITGDGVVVTPNGTADSLVLLNEGTLEKTGGFSGTSTIDANLTNAGLVLSRNGTLLLNGSVTNQGIIEGATGGNIDIAGSLTGSGNILINQGGRVEIGGASGEDVQFTGAGVLQLDDPSGFSGTISGLVAGSEIVLGGASATSTSLSGSVLTVHLSNGGSLNLSVTGLQRTDDLSRAGNVLTGTSLLAQATPALIVTGATAAPSVLAGRPFPVTWTDSNQGDLAAVGPWTDEIFIASDAAGDNAQLVGTLDFSGTLDPGQSVPQTLDVTLPGTTSGDDYFLVKTDALNQVANDGTGPDRQGITSAVTIVPTAVPTPPITLSGINLGQGSNLGEVTVTIEGSQLSPNDQVALIGAGGTATDASQVDWVNAGTLWASFNLTGLPTGSYSLQVSNATGSASLPSVFQVDSEPAGQLSVNLILPEYTNYGQSGTGVVTYSNTGDTDIQAPILDVSSSQATLSLSGSAAATGTIDFLGTNPNGPAGILAPGASGSVSFTYTPTAPTAQGDVTIAVGTAEQGATIDWSSLESALQPPTVDTTDWNNVYTAFVDQVGTTTDSLNTALSQDATELSQVGQPTNDIPTLLQYQLFQASGALAGTDLTEATDIAPTSSSLSLSLERFYDGTLLGRDATGAFGDGWTSNYDVTATTDASGNVYIQAPGVLHIFTLQPNGSYVAQAGDPATLTLSDDLYRMNDGSGDIDQFNATGKLASMTDANGNVVSLAYGANGVLATVTAESTGETITFTSNAAGRITSATDSDGQSVTYTYNAAGTQLLSASGAGGVTDYSYVAPTGSVQDNALTSINGPDGTAQSFTYDSEGRLATQSGAGGAGLQTYSYGAGQVTVTDALGNPTTLLYGADGAVEQVQDALGNVTQLASDTAGELTGVATAGGSVYQYGYDALGHLTSYIDPLGGTISAGYAPGTQNLTDFTDQRGNSINYTYDSAGNVTGITYADGSGDTYDYNLQGLLTSSTDADGSTTSYAYNAAGDLTSETFANGTANTYAYDSQGNLIAATAPGEGTTSYTYNAADQLTRVTNPQGQVESYTYNVAGELATRTEPGGSVEQFSYDADGQLTELQDGSGNLLDKYTYNAAGELARTDTGNGASTTYAYDGDGNVTQITNNNADGSVGSFYDYTYNANGQVVEEVTSDGAWSYGYDASGELTSAVFQSINTAVPSYNSSYVYDAAGNRISQTVNGVVTHYMTNNLNQYTTVGGTTYTYNADGDVVSETDSSGTTSFAYNANGQLTSEIGPSGTYAYVYDALDNLVQSVQNGATTDYVNDPFATSIGNQPLTSIAQSYGPSGNLLATYDYGIGFAAYTTSSGDLNFVSANQNGDVIELTSSTAHATQPVYEPFGQATLSGFALSPYNFLGQVGGLNLTGPFYLLGPRVYDASLGRFLQPDPVGLIGGPNLYNYAFNDPVNGSDPRGLDSLGKTVATTIQQVGAPIQQANQLAQQLTPGINAQIAQANRLGMPDVAQVLSGVVPILQEPAAGVQFLGGAASLTSQGPEALNGGRELVEAANASVSAKKLAKFAEKASHEAKTIDEANKSSQDTASGLDFYIGQLKKIFSSSTAEKPKPAQPASGTRDPHLTTFDGLRYDFQTAGEFVLTRQVSGGNFEVQARISAPVGVSSYSVITELGIQVGADRVTIDSTRPDAVWVNGRPAAFTAGILSLADGQVTQTASGYVVTLASGESVLATIDSVGAQIGAATTSQGIDFVITLNPFVEGPESVQGLLGDANGNPSQDLTLADGTVLPTNMPSSELYGAYANAWRVTQATSLLDYGPGQTTATFTDENYPGTPITLASFPQAAVQAAESLAAKAGITDPGLQQDAAYDYLVTGDPNSFTVEERTQQQGVVTTANAQITTPAATVPDVGIYGPQDNVTEAASVSTTVDFQLYCSGDTSEAVTLSYSVVAPDDTYVDASAFGGTLPSGTVTLAAGQTSADLPITLTQGIGTAASKTLSVQVTAPSPADVIGSTAEVVVANSAPTAGPPGAFAVELLNDATVMPTISGNTWTFDLGSLSDTTFGDTGTIELAVVNTATFGSDDLAGTIAATGDGGVATTKVPNFASLAPSEILDIADFSLGAPTTGSGTETLTFTLSDTNSTGYTATLPAQTVTIDYTAPASTMPCFAAGTRIATDTGERTVQSLRVGDRVRTVSGALRPIIWIGSRTVDCARHANPAALRPVRVRAGAFGPGLPRRDLFLSPDHAVYVRGVLVPIKHLIDGVAIAQTRRRRVTYFHIELATHDVLLAEGLAAESYLDTGDRDCFADDGVIRLHPAFGARRADLVWEAAGYAPLVITGPKIKEIRDLIAGEHGRLERLARSGRRKAAGM